MSSQHHMDFQNDHRFDLLADGELPPEEYRNLLASLDDEPGGWRRCALALLEAQAWAMDLGGIEQDVRTIAPAHKNPGSTRSEIPWKGLMLAAAASFLLALGLGLVIRDWWHPSNPGGAGIATHRPDATPADTPDLVERQQRTVSHPPMRHVSLVVDDGDSSTSEHYEVDLPVTEMNQLDREWMFAPRSVIPPDVIRALRRMGNDVRQQHEFVPVDLRDGRQLVVPVEEVQIVPVSDLNYQ